MAIAYFLDPVADRLERFGAPRWLAATCVLLFFVLILVLAVILLVPLIQSQITQLLDMVRPPEAPQAAIASLPKKLRDALMLAGAGNHSYDEIGRLLKIPTGTVKWRVSEARKVLRQKMTAMGYTDV